MDSLPKAAMNPSREESALIISSLRRSEAGFSSCFSWPDLSSIARNRWRLLYSRIRRSNFLSVKGQGKGAGANLVALCSSLCICLSSVL